MKLIEERERKRKKMNENGAKNGDSTPKGNFPSGRNEHQSRKRKKVGKESTREKSHSAFDTPTDNKS